MFNWQETKPTKLKNTVCLEKRTTKMYILHCLISPQKFSFCVLWKKCPYDTALDITRRERPAYNCLCCIYQNTRWLPFTVFNFHDNTFIEHILTLCVIIRSLPTFPIINFKNLLILYSGKYSILSKCASFSLN